MFFVKCTTKRPAKERGPSVRCCRELENNLVDADAKTVHLQRQRDEANCCFLEVVAKAFAAAGINEAMLMSTGAEASGKCLERAMSGTVKAKVHTWHRLLPCRFWALRRGNSTFPLLF